MPSKHLPSTKGYAYTRLTYTYIKNPHVKKTVSPKKRNEERKEKAQTYIIQKLRA